jgi:hypothetical protein
MNRPNPIALLTALALFGGAVLLTTILGCADRNSAVPISATLRAEGNGDKVSAAADPGGGTAYVYDATDNKLVWSGEVHSGQTVAVSARDDNITVDGRVVHQKDIHPGHKYRIFFDRKIHT